MAWVFNINSGQGISGQVTVSLRVGADSKPAQNDILFLCDYEFLGHKQTGLDIIEELGIAKQSILVTSRYEEGLVRARCARLGIKLIPKPLAGFVPIDFGQELPRSIDGKESFQ